MQKNGFFLIDVLVAVTIVGVLFITLMPTLSFLLQRSKSTRESVEASLLLQEGIEVAYNMCSSNFTERCKDGSYVVFTDTSSDTPLLTLEESDTSETLEAKYKRTITIQSIKRETTKGLQSDTTDAVVDPKSKKIVSAVTWTSGTHEQSVDTSLLVYDSTTTP